MKFSSMEGTNGTKMYIVKKERKCCSWFVVGDRLMMCSSSVSFAIIGRNLGDLCGLDLPRFVIGTCSGMEDTG